MTVKIYFTLTKMFKQGAKEFWSNPTLPLESPSWACLGTCLACLPILRFSFSNASFNLLSAYSVCTYTLTKVAVPWFVDEELWYVRCHEIWLLPTVDGAFWQQSLHHVPVFINKIAISKKCKVMFSYRALTSNNVITYCFNGYNY